MVKRSKTGRGDEAKLITKLPCFLAYYPGEQYFYCDRSDPGPIVADVRKSLNQSGAWSLCILNGKPERYCGVVDSISFSSMQAIVQALSATCHISIPLSGPNIESLRQMRLCRDGKRDPIDVAGNREGFVTKWIAEVNFLMQKFFLKMAERRTLKGPGKTPRGISTDRSRYCSLIFIASYTRLRHVL